jgi:uncharacterized protein YwqG
MGNAQSEVKMILKAFLKWSLVTAATFFLLTPVFFGLRASSLSWVLAVAVVFTLSSIAQKRKNIGSFDFLNLLRIASLTFVIQSLVVGVLYLIGHGIGRVLSYNMEGQATSGLFEGLMFGLLVLSSVIVELTKSLTAKSAIKSSPVGAGGIDAATDATALAARLRTSGVASAAAPITYEPHFEGSDHFQIGDHKYGFSDKCIASFNDGKLQLEVYSEDGKGFRFSDFIFPGTEPYLKTSHPGGQSYIWESGFSFGDRFFGEIRIQPGAFAMKGEVRPDYEPAGSGIPVSTKMTLPAGSVDPRHFKFSSLAEAESAGADCVYSLNLTVTSGDEFARVLKFKKLTELIVRAELEAANVGSSLDTSSLLTGISQLQNLNRIWFTSDVSVEIPIELFSISSLTDLSFSAKAKELPIEIMKLENLESLRINGNQFTTLPSELGYHPRLRYLNIEDCRFETLPPSIAKIKTIKIENHQRALYMDLSYPYGKDVVLDHEMYLARSAQASSEILDGKISAHGLGGFQEFLRMLARCSIDLGTPRDVCAEKLVDFQTKPTIGGSRLGGSPDLSSVGDWPLAKDHTDVERKMRFLAQLNCADLARLQGYLPRRGLISFFIDQWNDHPSIVRALYFPSTDGFSTVKLSDAEILSDGESALAFPGVPLEPRSLISIPDLSVDEGLLGPKLAEDFKRLWDEGHGDAYEKLKADLDSIQATGGGRYGPHTINAFVFTQGETPEMEAAEEKLGAVGDWVNLISIGFDRNVGFQFGDCGTLTICIHKSDLAAGNFTRVFPSFYTS